MDYYSYSYPARVKTATKKIRHIVDTTPEKYKSTYNSRIVGGRESDQFIFTPTINISKRKMDYERQLTKSYLYPDSDGTGMIREIHTDIYEPQKFNENGIIRERDNYLLYENKNWTENIRYPIVEYEKINIPKPKPMPIPKPKPKPKSKPKPKPKPEPIIEKEVEVINEEIERDEEKKKKLLKSNYIRKRDKLKNKKYKFKKINYDNRNFIRKLDNNYENEDNIVNIYDGHSGNDDNNNDSGDNEEDNGLEIKKIKKLTEQKKITGEYNDLITTKKEYKLHKTSKIVSPINK